MSVLPKCHECDRPVYHETEIELCLCNRCADRMYQRECERREFEYYHKEDAR